MQLDEVKTESARLSPWAHIATVGADGRPDVVPVHPAWVDDTLWFLSDGKSVKVRNIAANPDVAMHWQVGESGDGIEMWGRATVHTDVETKRRLWKGVFDYDLDAFSPGGPETPGVCFVAVEPDRVVFLKNYGTAGRDTWRRA